MARLTKYPLHILQFEHGAERLVDDPGHQLRTKSPGQNVTADVILPGTGRVDF